MGIYAVGEVIRRNRESIGMTQKELCDGICSVETLSRIENGRNTPSRANFERLMERMGKTGKKYLPFVRSKDIENHLLREEVERLISVHDYRSAERKLQELEEHLEMEDAVNRQYVLRIKAVVEGRLGKISVSERREKLKDALKCTVPSFSKRILENGILTEQEVRIICNIAMTYMEEKQYEQSIELLQKLRLCMENASISDNVGILRLVFSNLGQALGIKGDTQRAMQAQMMAFELAKKENNAGGMALILYDLAYDSELCGVGKDICLQYLTQAYILTECTENGYMSEHIRKHIIDCYGEQEWNKFKCHLGNDRLKE